MFSSFGKKEFVEFLFDEEALGFEHGRTCAICMSWDNTCCLMNRARP